MMIRSYGAGINLGKVIVEMVNLMYQNNTAKNFYSGLLLVLSEELKRREIKVKLYD